VSNHTFGMNLELKRSWSVAELVPLILTGLVGLILLFAAPAKLPSSTTIPQRTPRLSPTKPSPTNKPLLAWNALCIAPLLRVAQT
jgi:hypothetical protein